MDIDYKILGIKDLQHPPNFIYMDVTWIYFSLAGYFTCTIINHMLYFTCIDNLMKGYDMKFKVEISETTNKVVEVEAEDVDTACEIVEDRYKDGDIVLDSSDFLDVEFNPC